MCLPILMPCSKAPRWTFGTWRGGEAAADPRAAQVESVGVMEKTKARLNPGALQKAAACAILAHSRGPAVNIAAAARWRGGIMGGVPRRGLRLFRDDDGLGITPQSQN